VSTVYSARLVANFSFSGPATAAYTVPSGKRTVVTCIAYSVGVNAVPGYGQVLADPGPTPLYTYFNSFSDPTTDVKEGRWVLNEGDQLYILSNTWVGAFYVSGFELILP